jgi:hypothetical protein
MGETQSERRVRREESYGNAVVAVGQFSVGFRVVKGSALCSIVEFQVV